MSESTQPPVGNDAEYRLPGNHHERYGLDQYQPGLREQISIPWTGSARELIREDIEDAWKALEPRGCALRCFVRNKTRVTIRTLPEAKALWGQITDELHRRRIDDRQRNSLHRVRDELESEFEDQREKLEQWAKAYWNGHHFRSEGDIPQASVAVGDVRLDAPVTEQEFARGRVQYHTPHRPSDEEIERAVADLPVMYGYEESG